ncbi:MAG: YciI family protein [Povalibacter sp.]
MRTKLHSFALSAALLCAMQVSASESEIAPAQYDAALAKKLGADERGMRKYVLVVLKTGPHRVPDGAERQDMFKGHFANIERLANAGLLVMAGPLDGVDGWRGLFMFAVNSIDEASKLVATDPVIVKGEMVAEYHEHYGSAALMLVNDWHKKLSRPQQ